MEPAQFRMEALAEHLTATYHYSSDKRIRTDSPAPALRKLQRSREK
jgi:hypothetical protein